jgi:hypothetical protein
VRHMTTRAFLALMSDSALCRHLTMIDVRHENLELGAHVCELAAGHFGVHLCWCGSAFNDIGEVFSQRPLPRLLD